MAVNYDGWGMVFFEVFDDPLDWDKWNDRYIWPRDQVINNELQYYVPHEGIDGWSPFMQSHGMLYIQARKTPTTSLIKSNGQPYQSGVLTSQGHYSQQYGRIEARIQVPWGRGFWPAFWILPEFERWPYGINHLPEIDVMELLGHDPKTYYTTVHSNVTEQKHYSSYHNFEESLSLGFHVFGVEWDDELIKWYLDDEYVFEQPTPTDHHQPKHFLLNLAIGGDWPGGPDETTPFPVHMKVDWVRGWQKSNRTDDEIKPIYHTYRAIIQNAITELERLEKLI